MNNLKLSNVLLIGATGDIGKAIVSLLQTDYPGTNIFGTTRCIPEDNKSIEYIELDVAAPSDWEKLNEYFSQLKVEFDLVVSCIGILEYGDYLPEKSLKTSNRWLA
jgi:short-subunit dehydrogenase